MDDVNAAPGSALMAAMMRSAVSLS